VRFIFETCLKQYKFGVSRVERLGFQHQATIWLDHEVRADFVPSHPNSVLLLAKFFMTLDSITINIIKNIVYYYIIYYIVI